MAERRNWVELSEWRQGEPDDSKPPPTRTGRDHHVLKHLIQAAGP